MDNADTDSSVDLYERIGDERTVLRSTGEINGNGAFDVTPFGGSERVLFATAEQLVPGDTDTEPDLYAQEEGRTSLVSTGDARPRGAGSDRRLARRRRPTPTHRRSAAAPRPQSQVEMFTDAAVRGLPLASGSAADLRRRPACTVHGPRRLDHDLLRRRDRRQRQQRAPARPGSPTSRTRPPCRRPWPRSTPAGPGERQPARGSGAAPRSGATVRLFTDPLCAGAPAGERLRRPSSPGRDRRRRPRQLRRPGSTARIVDPPATSPPVRAGSPRLRRGLPAARDDDLRRPPQQDPRRSGRSSPSSASEPATFTCRVDGRRPSPARSPYRTPGLRFGSATGSR